jgi:hypothetical protein
LEADKRKTVIPKMFKKENNYNVRSICLSIFNESYSIITNTRHKIGDLRKTVGMWLDLRSIKILISIDKKSCNDKNVIWELIDF